MTSAQDTAALVKLFLEWPGRHDDHADEAAAFRDWLRSERADAPARVRCDDGAAADFLERHADVVAGCRTVRDSAEPVDGPRRFQRLRLVTEVFLVVTASDEEPQLVGSSLRGVLTDISETGIGFESDASLPPGTVVELVIASPSPPLEVFTLQGEIRWRSSDVGRAHSGIRFLDIENARTWLEAFLSGFMPR